VLRAIERARIGELWLDRAATGRLFVQLSRAASQKPAERRKQGRAGTLTPRERMIVAEMARDAALSIRQVAARLGISDRTLRNHLTAIYDKLGGAGRLALWDYAHRNNLVKPLSRARTATTLDA
jgi:two-component system, NarL family, nitrate/nitrite response regulator NarL